MVIPLSNFEFLFCWKQAPDLIQSLWRYDQVPTW